MKTSCNVARDCDSSKRYSRKELEGQGHGVRLRRVKRREAEEEYLHGDGDHQLNVNVLDLVHESHHNTATMARLAGILLMFEKRLSLSFHIKLQISGVWSLEAPFPLDSNSRFPTTYLFTPESSQIWATERCRKWRLVVACAS